MDRATRRLHGRARTMLTLLMALAFTTFALSGCGILASDTGVAQTDPVKSDATGAEKSADTTATPSEETSQAPAETVSEQILPHPIPWGEVSDKVAAGAKLLCVDRAEDYKIEHVAGATSVPAGEIDAKSNGWSEDSPVVLTGPTEEVARSTASHLARNGFTNVYYFAGGYDDWGGTFEGTDPRKATVPAKVYFLYSGETEMSLSSDMFIVPSSDVSAEVATNMKGLKDEFDGDVEFTLIDVDTDPSGAVRIVDTYDVPVFTLLGIDVLVTPRWVLVGKDGRVTHLGGTSVSGSLGTMYGWCCEQAEAE